jgi:hypothetical protein
MTGQAELDLRHHYAVVPDEDFGAAHRSPTAPAQRRVGRDSWIIRKDR